MSHASSPVRDVAIDDLKTGLRDGTMTVVDVREDHEFSAGAIPGSVSMPLSRFDPAELPTTGRIVFSCAAGVRSRRAIEIAQAQGHDLSEHFAGGFKGWMAAGEPIG